MPANKNAGKDKKGYAHGHEKDKKGGGPAHKPGPGPKGGGAKDKDIKGKEKKPDPIDKKKDGKNDKGKNTKPAEPEAPIVVNPEDLLKGEHGKRIFTKRLMYALQPVRWLAIFSGHWPLAYKEQPDGSFKFKHSPFYGQSIHFFFMLFLSFFCLITMGINYIYLAMELEILKGEDSPTFREERWYEITLFWREMVWQMSMTCAVIQSCFATYHIFAKRHHMASVYTFYTRVVQQLHMDLSAEIFKTELVLIVLYLLSTLGIVVMGILHFAPVTSGSPTLFGVFVFRQFAEWQGLWIKEPTTTRKTVQILGAITMIMILNSSKIQIFFFTFHCKLLRNAFSTWNGRTYVTVMKGGKYIGTEEGRTTFHLLYKDHCVILDMLEGSNRVFSTIMESYFACQLSALFMEIYFFLRCSQFGSTSKQTQGALGGGTFFLRPNDWIPAAMLFIQSSIILYIATQAAAAVGQEAMVGVDIIRRKTMINRKTDDELLFQLSMDISYNAVPKMDVSAGGYEYINKEWVMGFANNLASYFVIMYQFSPTLDRKTEGDWPRREAVGNFLTNLEYFKDPMHWQSTSPPPHPTYPP